MEALWSLMTVIGPLLLLGVLVWAYLRNRGQSRAEVQRSEQCAKELRERLDAEDTELEPRA